MAATKVKKPEICTYWWEKVLQYEPTHEEALDRALQALRAQQGVGQARRDLPASGRRGVGREGPRRRAAAPRPPLHGEGREHRQGDRRVAAAARDRREQPSRAGRAQEAVRHRRSLGRARGVLPSRGKIDEYIRVLEREVESGSETHRLVARDEDRGALPRRAAEGRSRDARVREGALARREQPRRRRGADPALRGGPRSARRSSACSRSSSARRHRRQAHAPGAHEAARAVQRGASCATRARRSAGGSRRTPRITSPRRSASEIERLAAETQRLERSSSTRTPRRCRSSATGDDALPLMLVMARVIEQEQGDVDRALDMNRADPRARRAQRAGARRARAAVPRQGRSSTSCSSIYEKKLELDDRRRRADRDPVEDRSALRRRGQGRQEGDRRLPWRSSTPPATSRSRCRASTASTCATSSGRSSRTSSAASSRSSVPTRTSRAHVELKFRLGQLKEQHLGDVAGAIDVVPRHPRHRRRPSEGARVRSRSHLRGDDKQQARRRRASSSPSTSSSKSGRRSSACTRSSSRAEKDSSAARRCCSASASCSARSCSTPRRRSTRYARAFREDPSTEAAKDQLEALAPLIEDGWARLVKLFEGALEPRRTSTRSSPTSSRPRSRVATRIASATARRPSSSSSGARDRARRPRRARRARGDLHARREVPRAARDLSPSHRHRERARRAARVPVPHRLDPRGDARRARRGDRDLQRDPRPGARRLQGAARARSAVRGGRQWRDLGDNLSRQLTLVEEPYEQVACWSASRSCARRTSTRSRAAVETYRQVLEHEDQNRDAVAGLERLIGNPSTSCTIANILEPIYKARGEWTKQIGVYEIMAKHAFDPHARSSCSTRSPSYTRSAATTPRPRSRPSARAMREDPRNETRTPSSIAWRAASIKWAEVAALYDGRDGSAGGRPQGRAPVPPRPDPGARAARRQGRGRDLRARAQGRRRRPSRPRPRSRRSTSAPATGRSSSTS